MSTGAITLLVTSWLIYFGIHSLLASLRCKNYVAQKWPSLLPSYRLIFNAVALIMLVPPLALTALHSGLPLWQWPGPIGLIMNMIALLAGIGFIWTLRFYDSSEFFGFRQHKEQIKTVKDLENFCISPLHRFVRHPWYFLAMVLIWSREMDLPTLISALLISLYFIVGSRLEENKLITYHGEVYKRYRSRVAALFPIPWRYLSRHEAELLLNKSDNEQYPSR